MLLRAVIVASLLASTAQAASFDDPDWPCIQRKVLELSIGQMWAGPLVDEAIQDLAKDDDIRALAARLAVRRTSLEEAQVLVSEFADDLDDNENTNLTALFTATFNHINRDRSAIINGIARYAQKQTGLTDLIETRRGELIELSKAEEPNYDRIEEIEDQLVWDTRIFEDRKQSLIYVCETPVILEKRAFGIGRMIGEALN